MVKSTDYYINLDKLIIENDRERDKEFIKYQDEIHCEYDLPNDLPEWVRPMVSSDAAVAVSVATQTLSSLDPLIEVLPLAANPLNREQANKIEQCLKWQFYSASRRRSSPVVEDLVRSAIVYDAIAVFVADLDYLAKSAKEAGVDANRYKYMRRHSRFLMNTYNPLFVHARMSNYGPECVVVKQEKSAYQIWKEFGDQVGQQIIDMAKDEKKDYKLVLYDHWDDEVRFVYTLEDNTHQFKGENHDPITIIAPYEHKLGFLPWAIRFGSNTLEYEDKFKYNGMLSILTRTGEWDTFNLADSLMTSKAIATSGKPDLIEEGDVAKSTTTIDYDSPVSVAKATPGNKLRDLQPSQLDPRLYEMRNDLKSRMGDSTVANILRTAQSQANEAYASLNLRVLTALGQLKPYKRKAEMGIEDVCDIMMHWVEKSGKPLTSYNNNKRSKSYGEYYQIEPDEFDADSLIYKVELKADLPIDQLQRINGANQAVTGLGLSKERALELVGFGDASQIIDERYLESMKEFVFSLQQQKELAMMQFEIESMRAQQQMQMQAAQAAANPQGVPGAEGMNPAEGNIPPAMANPGATRETQTGMTRTGEPNAGGMGL